MQGSVENVNIEETASELGAKTVNMAASLIIAKFLSFIILGIGFIVIARILQPTLYGYYTLALAISGFFGSFADFGVGTAWSKFIAEYRAKRDGAGISSVLSNGLAILLIGGTVFTCLSIAFSYWTAQNVMHDASLAYLIQVASLTIILSMLYGSSTSALIGFGKGKYVALSTASAMMMQSAASVSLALLGFGALGPTIGLVIAYLFGFLLSLWLIMKEMKSNKARFKLPSIDGIKKLFGFSAPLAFVNLISSLTNNFATIFLGLFVVTAVVGNYGLSSKIGGLIDVGVSSVALALLPTFTITLTRKKSETDTAHFYNVALHSAVVFLAPLIFFIAVMAKPLVYTIFGGAYVYAPLYLQIVSLGLLIGIGGSYTNSLLISGNMVRSVLKYNFIIAVIQVLLLLLLVPTYGGLGATVVIFFITAILNTLIFVRKAIKAFHVKLWTGKIVRATVANIVTIAIVYLLRFPIGGSYIVLLVASALLYLILYPTVIALLKGIDRSDLDRLLDVTRKVPFVNTLVPIVVQYTSIFVR